MCYMEIPTIRNWQNPHLVDTENAILGYDGIFGITETEWEVQKEREVSATKQEALEQQSAEKIDETLLLHGESGRFAIYQMDSGDEHTYQFMGIESAKNLGYTIDGKRLPDGLCSTVDANNHVRQYI